MFHEEYNGNSDNFRVVVDKNNRFFGLFDKKNIRGASLFYRTLAVLVRNKKKSCVLLYKSQLSLFDFTFSTNHDYDKSSEDVIESKSLNLFGEKPLQIMEIGTIEPEGDRISNFTTFFEIYYPDSFLRNAIRQDIFSLQDNAEFINLCRFYPQDIAPLLRKTALALYKLDQNTN